MVTAICWQITKMLLVLLSVLHPLGLPNGPNMPGRASLWSVTHCALSSAAPWVQAITVCPLHNFRISLSESADDEKKNPIDWRFIHCYVNQKAYHQRRVTLICKLLLSLSRDLMEEFTTGGKCLLLGSSIDKVLECPLEEEMWVGEKVLLTCSEVAQFMSCEWEVLFSWLAQRLPYMLTV